MDRISRTFTKTRNNFDIKYPFTTYDVVFSRENPVYEHLANCIIGGRPKRKQSVTEFCKKNRIGVKASTGNREFCKYARESNYQGQGRQQHAICQEHFMSNHPNALAMEVPVWDDELNGFIDLLLWYPEVNEIIILDFKPDALKHKVQAKRQVYMYRKLLSQHTDFSLEKIHAGFFDDNHCYFIS